MNSVTAVGKALKISTAGCWSLAAAGEKARALSADQPALQAGKGGCATWCPETLSVGRRAPLPAYPARPTRKCRSQRVPRTSPSVRKYRAHGDGSPILLFNAVGVRVER